MSNDNNNKRKSPEIPSPDLPKPPEEKRPRGICPIFWFSVKDIDLEPYGLLEYRIPADSLLWAVSHAEVPVVDAGGVRKPELVLGLPGGIPKSEKTALATICRNIFEILDERVTTQDLPFSAPSVLFTRSICNHWKLPPEIVAKTPLGFPAGNVLYGPAEGSSTTPRHQQLFQQRYPPGQSSPVPPTPPPTRNGALITEGPLDSDIKGCVFLVTKSVTATIKERSALVILSSGQVEPCTWGHENLLGYGDRVVVNIEMKDGRTLSLTKYRNGKLTMKSSRAQASVAK